MFIIWEDGGEKTNCIRDLFKMRFFHTARLDHFITKIPYEDVPN